MFYLEKKKKIVGIDEKTGKPIFSGSEIGDTQRTGGLL